MDTHARTAVIGGGIFGCSTALALARQGFGHVEVWERDHVGSGSTALAGGLLSLHTWNDADAQLIRETRAQLIELVQWGQDHELPSARTAWRPTGGLTIGPAASEGLLDAFRQRLRRYDVSSHILEAKEVTQRFPQFLMEPSERALWSSEGGIIESTDLLELLRAQAKELGVRFRESLPVSRIVVEDGQVRRLEATDGQKVRLDAVAVCGGAWTKKLLATCGVYVPLAAYRTQIATIEIPDARDIPILHDLAHGFYARAESETRMLAGDGTQLREFDPDAFDAAPDADFVESIARRVLARFRRGVDANYRSGWAGLCAGTPDRRPLMGAVPGARGLWILSGDNGFGLMRGLALGTRLAGQMAERPVMPDDPAARLDRFGLDPPKGFPLSEGFSYPDLASLPPPPARRL